MLLPEELPVLRRHEAALAGDGVDKARPFQLLIGPLGGDDADAQVLGKAPDAEQGLVLLQLAS